MVKKLTYALTLAIVAGVFYYLAGFCETFSLLDNSASPTTPSVEEEEEEEIVAILTQKTSTKKALTPLEEYEESLKYLDIAFDSARPLRFYR